MSTHYKGFPIPEVMQDEILFHIICDEGIFDGYSEHAVLKHWENKVDALVRYAAIEDGYSWIDDEHLECPSCGAVVRDAYKHEIFHKDLTS